MNPPFSAPGATRIWLGRILGTAAMLGLAGCAATSLPTGDRMLRSGDYAAAAEALRAEETARPQDPVVKRNLGIALAESGNPAEAVTKLTEAVTLAPQDPLSHYFLGRAAEAAGNPELALQGYTLYREKTGKNPPELKVRVRELTRRVSEAEIQRALAAEKNLQTLTTSPNTVAVPAYNSLVAESDLAVLGRGLAVMLITDLSKVSQLRVVERAKMNVLIEELDLAAPTPPSRLPEPEARQWSPLSSVQGMKERLAALRGADGVRLYAGAIDNARDEAFIKAVKAFQSAQGLTADGIPGPKTQAALQAAVDALPKPEIVSGAPAVAADTAPRLGRLLGAGRLVQGAFLPGAETVQLEAVVITTASGEVAPGGAPISGPLVEVLQLQKQLTYQVLAALGHAPTPGERREIDKLPTRSFEAFLAYSRGLDFEDRGMTREAFNAFREAVALDPDFQIAQEEVELGEVTPEREREFGAGREEEVLRVQEDPTPRLVQTGSLIGIGPGPDRDIGDDLDPGITEVEKIENASIVIEGRLPRGVQP